MQPVSISGRALSEGVNAGFPGTKTHQTLKEETNMMCALSRLDEGKLATIKSVEQKIGKTILAYNCHDIMPAELSKDEMAQLAETEKKLGVVLVAVKS